MDAAQILDALDPVAIERRLAELDRERAALLTLLRASRQRGRRPPRGHGQTAGAAGEREG